MCIIKEYALKDNAAKFDKDTGVLNIEQNV